MSDKIEKYLGEAKPTYVHKGDDKLVSLRQRGMTPFTDYHSEISNVHKAIGQLDVATDKITDATGALENALYGLPNKGKYVSKLMKDFKKAQALTSQSQKALVSIINQWDTVSKYKDFESEMS